MRVFAIVKNARRTALLALPVTGFVLLMSSASAHAMGQTIQAVVCGGDSGSLLTIDQPKSDSVVAGALVRVSGIAASATAIEVKVDGGYNSTGALNDAQTTFDAQVMLQPGTHTISLQANDICLTRNAEASVVVTYQPAGQAGNGVDTTTAAGGVVIGPDVPVVQGQSPTRSGVESLLAALDFDTVTQDGMTKATLRLGLMFSGLAVGLGGSRVLGQILPRVRNSVLYVTAATFVFLALIV